MPIAPTAAAPAIAERREIQFDSRPLDSCSIRHFLSMLLGGAEDEGNFSFQMLNEVI